MGCCGSQEPKGPQNHHQQGQKPRRGSQMSKMSHGSREPITAVVPHNNNSTARSAPPPPPEPQKQLSEVSRPESRGKASGNSNTSHHDLPKQPEENEPVVEAAPEAAEPPPKENEEKEKEKEKEIEKEPQEVSKPEPEPESTPEPNHEPVEEEKKEEVEETPEEKEEDKQETEEKPEPPQEATEEKEEEKQEEEEPKSPEKKENEPETREPRSPQSPSRLGWYSIVGHNGAMLRTTIDTSGEVVANLKQNDRVYVTEIEGRRAHIALHNAWASVANADGNPILSRLKIQEKPPPGVPDVVNGGESGPDSPMGPPKSRINTGSLEHKGTMIYQGGAVKLKCEDLSVVVQETYTVEKPDRHERYIVEVVKRNDSNVCLWRVTRRFQEMKIVFDKLSKMDDKQHPLPAVPTEDGMMAGIIKKMGWKKTTTAEERMSRFQELYNAVLHDSWLNKNPDFLKLIGAPAQLASDGAITEASFPGDAAITESLRHSLAATPTTTTAASQGQYQAALAETPVQVVSKLTKDETANWQKNRCSLRKGCLWNRVSGSTVKRATGCREVYQFGGGSV
eukprot:TRINITY_DN302_c2_g1_i1.p1 TRINITY_DN302_c2_g1~~TRINITY_DN302_c2_g1_i1.p1  ORF type:complete len:565 (+),score=124.46 TRINITY_DN302_c2_g1_i1:140-1834(+)